MKKIINSILGYLGYKLIRADKENYPSASIKKHEYQEIKHILREFSGTYNGAENFSYTSLKNYLSKERIGFFHQLILLCEKHNIELAQKDIADVGCGMGYLLRCVHDKTENSNLFGFDTFGEMLQLAQKICPSAVFKNIGLFEVSQKFDIIFCTEVVEHLVQPHKAVTQLFSLLNPGGILIVTIPDGRYDTFPAGKKREDGTAYWGHVHFWSTESWPIFLDRELTNVKEIKTGKVNAKNIYGILYA